MNAVRLEHRARRLHRDGRPLDARELRALAYEHRRLVAALAYVGQLAQQEGAKRAAEAARKAVAHA